MKRAPKWVKKYGLLKWDYIRNNGGSSKELEKKYPKTKQFEVECSYCEYYDSVCMSGCPLGVSYLTCCDRLHLKWLKAKTKKTKLKYANLIYEYIKKHG